MAINVTTPGNETAADDLVVGTVNDDIVDALEGDDIIVGVSGDDKISGGDGDDLLIGGTGDDVLVGDAGTDTMLGGAGDDTMVWNNGDGSDQMDGGADEDRAVVNGSDTAGDEFEIKSDGSDINFARTNFGPFEIDISNTEVLEVNALGGDDKITASEGMAGLINLEIDAGAGNDMVTGSDGDDVINGGEGDDVIVGAKGDDMNYGGAGDDLLVWNNGDGSDLMHGGDGNDRVQVNGADISGDEFTVKASSEGVTFARENLGLFQLDIREVETLEVNGQGGDDKITASEGLAGVIKLEVNAGDGDDTVTGSDGSDVIYGDDGNDVIIGAKGDDTNVGGAGDDVLIWNNGDGSDQMIGGTGEDRVQVNGADTAGDEFAITAGVDGGVQFNRVNLGLFQLDISEVETLEVNGQGGDDKITASEGLAGLIDLEINAGAGDDTVTGSDGEDVIYGDAGDDVIIGAKGDDMNFGGVGDDLLVWNNGDGSDLMHGGDGEDRVQVNGADTAGDEFTITASAEGVAFARENLGLFQLDIREVETLHVNGQGGDDVITGSEGLADKIELRLDGGDGNDVITGGDGDDLLLGGAGNDLLIGGKGADVMLGEGGRDTMVWNNGDGSDAMNGGAGRDTAIVNGAEEAGDVFTIDADGNGVAFARTNLGEFTIDIEATEVLEVNALGGDDTVTAGEGLAENIRLRIDAGDGDDTVTGGDGADVIQGGAGDDLIVGAKGEDRLFGGQGDDTFVWNNGDGSDVVRGNGGEDRQIVNGASEAGDVFEISRDGASVNFARTNLGEFELDLRKVEVLEVNGLGGDDTISAQGGNIARKISLDLDGGDGADVVTGGKGADVISGGADDNASDILTGGQRADTFVFAGNFGVDVVTDFQVGVDTILLEGTVLMDRAVEALAALEVNGDDVTLETGLGTITFEEATLADFTRDSFDFL